MMRLRNLQEMFAHEVLSGGLFPALRTDIRQRGLEAERRLQIYKNNINSTLTESLESNFPITVAMVGEDFFKYLAKKYIQQYAPATGDLRVFGENIPDFIEQMQETAHLGYLSDIARVDWACDCAFHAPAATTKRIECLADFRETDYANLIFDLHPSAQLIDSRYPLFDIWSYATGQNTEEPPQVNLPGQSVMVLRRKSQVKVIELNSQEFQFLSLLNQNKTLGTVISELSSLNLDYNLQALLQKCFHFGAISNVVVKQH